MNERSLMNRLPFPPLFLAAFLGLFFCLALAACGGDTAEQGIVASVNGRAVTLEQLEALRDATNMEPEVPLPHAVERLREEYGFALTELLLLELVNQQLEKKKIPVTPEEVAAEEAAIRGDYPGDSFETMVREQALDLTAWRFLLKNRLAVQKFRNQVLRPDISITSEEIEAYYQRNSAEFVRPAWVYFIAISGSAEKDVEEGRALLLSTADPARVQREHPGLRVYTARMGRKRLDPELAAAIAVLRPGQITPVRSTAEGFSTALLLEEGPEKRLSPTEAYPLIEDVLLDNKLQEAYAQWVQSALSKARIRVARQLLPPEERPEEPSGRAPGFSSPDPGKGSATVAPKNNP